MSEEDSSLAHAMRDEYAHTFARNVLGRAVKLSDAETSQIADALSRVEEIQNPTRDQWDNWEYRFSERGQAHEPHVPWLDEMLTNITTPGSAPASGSAWPDGHPFALCLTHDVDGVSSRSHERKFIRRLVRIFTASGSRKYAAYLAAGSLYRLATGIGKGDKLGCYERWLDLEARFGFHSTWYFLPSSYADVHVYDMDYRHDDPVLFRGQRMTVAALMREIDRAGAEVGLHGSYHSARNATILRDEREQVERALGAPVRSVRQHYLRYDPARTPSVQEQAGCTSDSTQGFNTTNGFRAGTSFPYRAWDHVANKPSSVLEIPMHVMDGPLMLAASYDPERAARSAFEMMDHVERVGGCLTVNWHPNNMWLPGHFEAYTRVLEEAASRGAWGCSATELTEWWCARERKLRGGE